MNTKSKSFITLSIFTIIIVSLNIFVPKTTWNKFFGNNFAAVFTSNTNGNWNSRITWGLNGGLTAMIQPKGLTVSATGEIYIADGGNQRIVVLNPDGTASTTYFYFSGVDDVAISSTTGEIYIAGGSSVFVLNPDGTASTTYTIAGGIFGIALASNGEIYLADSNNSRIVILNSDGTASTTYSLGFQPLDVALSSSGYIYIAQYNPGLVVVLNPDGTASTTYNGDIFAPINLSPSVTLSASGYIYVTDYLNNRIVVLNPDGTGSTTYNGDTFAPLGNPWGVALSPSGNIYIADQNNNRIVFLNPDGTASTSSDGLTLSPSYVDMAGRDYPGIGDNATVNAGTVILSQNESVDNLILAPGGTLDLNGYTLNVAGDWSNTGGTLINNGGTINLVGTTTQRILGINTFYNLTKFASTTSTLIFDYSATTTITGNLFLSGASGNLLTVTTLNGSVAPIWAQTVTGFFVNPGGITHNSSGDVYVSSISANTLKKFDNSGNFIASLTGTFSSPLQLAVDSNNNIYVAQFSGSILKFDSSDTFSTSTSVISQPKGISVDSSDYIYVNNGSSNSVVKLDSSFNIITSTTTANGINFSFGCSFGAGNIVDSTGNFLYVADSCNNRVVKLNTSDLSFVSSLTGTVDQPFDHPLSIAFDSSNNIYVINGGNQLIMKFDPSFSFLALFGGSGVANNQFSNAQQITIDSSDNIFITDISSSYYKKFTLAPFSPFQIFQSGIGSSTFSYLSVSASNNISTGPFYCSTGCVNVGANTNWIFPIATNRRRSNDNLDFATTTATTTMSLNSTTTATSTTVITTSITSQYFIFTRTLRFGSIGEDVRQLQIFLNTHGFPLAETGPGSLGQETNYFGPLTKAALIKFQEAYAEEILYPQGITKGTGLFLGYSKKVVNDILSK